MAGSELDSSRTMEMANSDVRVIMIPESRSSTIKMPRLPEEVLTGIFMETYDASNGKSCDVTWMPEVAHVCRFWRQVALSYSQLWTCINIEPRRHEHALHFIKLSKSLPLRLYMDTCPFYFHSHEEWDAFHQKSLMLLSSYMNRFSSIKLRFGSSHHKFIAQFSKALLEPAPLLERLEFYHINELDDDDHFFTLPWPNDPFIESAPRLTDVTMDGSLVTNWGSIFFDLLRLRIHNPNEYAFDLFSVFDILMGSPSLEIFLLQNAHLEEIDFDEPLNIDLPLLREVTLEDISLRASSEILHSINASPQAQFRIVCNGLIEDLECIQILPSNCESFPKAEIMNIECDYGPRITCSLRDQPVNTYNRFERLDVKIVYTNKQYENSLLSLDNFIRYIRAVLGTHVAIFSLKAICNDIDFFGDWFSLFSALPSLQKLSFVTSSHRNGEIPEFGLVDALQATPLPCPQLTHIVVHENRIPKYGRMLKGRFRACVRSRSKCGLHNLEAYTTTVDRFEVSKYRNSPICLTDDEGPWPRVDGTLDGVEDIDPEPMRPSG